MEKRQIKKLAGNPQFIKGIYNYCDHWCERCPLTSRCLNFASDSEESPDQKAHDITNEALWQKLAETFRITHELLEEVAAREGIDLDSIDLDEFSREERLEDDLVENHECCRLAKHYSEMVDDWFESAKDLFEQEEDELNPAAELDIPEVSPVEEDRSFTGAVDVVRWYQYQIQVKLMKAAREDLEKRAEILDEFSKDSDGMAKVALIGIDRSIAAWGDLRNHFPLLDDDVLHILVQLERLRRKVERAFPNARVFIRPGFDRIDLNS